MLSDGWFVYAAVMQPRAVKPVEGDPWLLLFMILFFGGVAWMLLDAMLDVGTEVKRDDDENRPD